MDKLVHRLENESSKERVAKKMINATRATKEGAGENAFIFSPENLMQTKVVEAEHEIELALQKVTAGGGAYSEKRLTPWLEGKDDAEAALFAAQQRWKWAHMRVRQALREISKARDQNEELQDTMGKHNEELLDKEDKKKKMAAGQAVSDSSLKLGVSTLSLCSLKEEATSMAEVHQTVINAARASYKTMFEGRSINAAPYRILSESLNLQEEMLLKVVEEASEEHAVMDDDKKTSARTLAGKVDQSVKLASVLNVGWDHIKKSMGKPIWGTVFYFVSLVCKTENWLEGTWWLLKRDAETVIAYVMTMEHLLEDLDLLDEFEDEVMTPMEKIGREAKNEAILQLTEAPYDDAMFMLFEHLLFARLLVRVQMHIIKHFEAHGVINNEDAEHVLTHHLLPTERALRYYVPEIGSLQAMGSKRVHGYSRSPVKSALAWLVGTGMSTNEELGDGE